MKYNYKIIAFIASQQLDDWLLSVVDDNRQNEILSLVALLLLLGVYAQVLKANSTVAVWETVLHAVIVEKTKIIFRMFMFSLVLAYNFRTDYIINKSVFFFFFQCITNNDQYPEPIQMTKARLVSDC